MSDDREKRPTFGDLMALGIIVIALLMFVGFYVISGVPELHR